MFGRNLQSPRCVMHHNLAQIVRIVEQIVADTATDIGVFYPFEGADFAIQIEQWAMVVIEIWADLRVKARWTHTLGAQRLILATQAIHICRWTTDIGNCAVEVGHLGYSLNLPHNRSLAT